MLEPSTIVDEASQGKAQDLLTGYISVVKGTFRMLKRPFVAAGQERDLTVERVPSTVRQNVIHKHGYLGAGGAAVLNSFTTGGIDVAGMTILGTALVPAIIVLSGYPSIVTPYAFMPEHVQEQRWSQYVQSRSKAMPVASARKLLLAVNKHIEAYDVTDSSLKKSQQQWKLMYAKIDLGNLSSSIHVEIQKILGGVKGLQPILSSMVPLHHANPSVLRQSVRAFGYWPSVTPIGGARNVLGWPMRAWVNSKLSRTASEWVAESVYWKDQSQSVHPDDVRDLLCRKMGLPAKHFDLENHGDTLRIVEQYNHFLSSLYSADLECQQVGNGLDVDSAELKKSVQEYREKHLAGNSDVWDSFAVLSLAIVRAFVAVRFDKK